MNTTQQLQTIGTIGTKTVHVFRDFGTGTSHTFCSARVWDKPVRTERVARDEAGERVTCKRCAAWL